ncbi:MAG: S41 family peptidase [Planctomycetaceae bacterium]
MHAPHLDGVFKSPRQGACGQGGGNGFAAQGDCAAISRWLKLSGVVVAVTMLCGISSAEAQQPFWKPWTGSQWTAPKAAPSRNIVPPGQPVQIRPEASPRLENPGAAADGQRIGAPMQPGLDDLVARAVDLEREGRWTEIIRLCEPLARSGRLSPQLSVRYDVARVHSDLARRYAEPKFRTAVSSLSEADARRLHAELLGRIESHYVEQPDFARLASRSRLALDVAIDDPVFLETLPVPVQDGHRTAFRTEMVELVRQIPVTSRADAERFAAWMANIAHRTLGIPPSATLMEACAAVMGGLDEYSAFLTGGQLDDLYAQIDGNFVGLGVELKESAEGLLVVNVITGSPAARSGLQWGDVIVAVAGRPLAGMGVDAASQLLQGPEGSVVTLASGRGPGPARAMTIRREHVDVPSVEDVRMVDPTYGVGYLRIGSFQKTTASDLDAAMRRLDASGMRSVIVDLRGNPGGLLSAGVDAADLFLERGLVVATRGRSSEEDFNYTATRSGTWRLPLVVLIDGDSASASEIFAGAIRDHRRGTIVGSRSYGKGSVQGIFPMEVGGVGIRLTTAKFYSPAGSPFSGVGVEPDLVVQTAMKPAEDVIGVPQAAGVSDPCLEAATEVARRQAVGRNAAGSAGSSPSAGRGRVSR